MTSDDFLKDIDPNSPFTDELFTDDLGIDELAARVPSYSDDFILPPLIPTVEDALILPRQTDGEAQEITPPDALHFMNPPSSN